MRCELGFHFTTGEYVKTGLAEVEAWIHAAGKDWVGESWDELRYIRQVLLGRLTSFRLAIVCLQSCTDQARIESGLSYSAEFTTTATADVKTPAMRMVRTTHRPRNGCSVVSATVPQAVTFLVIHQKHRKSLEEITNDLCPVLSVQQLYRISTMYWDDRRGKIACSEPCTRYATRRAVLTLPAVAWLARGFGRGLTAETRPVLGFVAVQAEFGYRH